MIRGSLGDAEYSDVELFPLGRGRKSIKIAPVAIRISAVKNVRPLSLYKVFLANKEALWLRWFLVVYY